ncbi:MAG: GNAT family N-acetyltransferase [Ruthenibacterium sp.]
MEYRRLSAEEICPGLFRHFVRRQQVTRCWCRENGEWRVKDTPFLDDWTPEDYETLARCLKNTCGAGGFVCAAFCEGALKGFASVEAGLFGGGRYLELSSLHVSQELRGQGVGKKLLHAAAAMGQRPGRKGFYISAHPAVESQAFTGQWAARFYARFAARPMRGAARHRLLELLP